MITHDNWSRKVTLMVQLSCSIWPFGHQISEAVKKNKKKVICGATPNSSRVLTLDTSESNNATSLYLNEFTVRYIVIGSLSSTQNSKKAHW